jgi:hypothetical protein
MSHGGGMGGHVGGISHGAGPAGHAGAHHAQPHQHGAHSKYYPPQGSTTGPSAAAGVELTWLGKLKFWFRRKNR